MSNKDYHLTPSHIENLRGNRRPETPIEALMMAGSREAEVMFVQELQPLREAIAECIEQLDAQDRYIVDAINSEVISLEELGRRLGVSKPHAWRLRNKAYERLKLILLEHPLIRERLGIHEDEADNGGI